MFSWPVRGKEAGPACGEEIGMRRGQAIANDADEYGIVGTTPSDAVDPLSDRDRAVDFGEGVLLEPAVVPARAGDEADRGAQFLGDVYSPAILHRVAADIGHVGPAPVRGGEGQRV